jgi:glutaredoxin
MKQVTLYHFNSCPFCSKVRYYLKEQNISILEKDILIDPEARNELLSIGGKTQVPCLVIDGKPLYESDDIIQWFKENYDN